MQIVMMTTTLGHENILSYTLELTFHQERENLANRLLKDYTNLVPDSTVSGKIHIAPTLEADILFLFFRVLWFKAVVFKALYIVRKSKS